VTFAPLALSPLPTMAIIDKCTISYKPRANASYPEGLTDIAATVTHPKYGKVADITAIKIHRGYMEAAVHRVLDDQTDELAEFSTTILDRFGNVRPWLVEPGWRSGSGVWGRELDEGQLLYISFVHVKKGVRFLFSGLYHHSSPYSSARKALAPGLSAKYSHPHICTPATSPSHGRLITAMSQTKPMFVYSMLAKRTSFIK
jgi:hypothetical protein